MSVELENGPEVGHELIPEKLEFESQYSQPEDLSIVYGEKISLVDKLGEEKKQFEANKIRKEIIDEIYQKYFTKYPEQDVFINVIVPDKKCIPGMFCHLIDQALKNLPIENIKDIAADIATVFSEAMTNRVKYHPEMNTPLKILIKKDEIQVLLGETNIPAGEKKEPVLPEDIMSENARGEFMMKALSDDYDKRENSYLFIKKFNSSTDGEV